MADWRSALAHLAIDTEEHFDILKYRLAYALGGPGPVKIVPYRGYGNHFKLYLKGRVLEEQGIIPASENDSLWDNLLNMYRRIESDEVPYARVRVCFQDVEQEVIADEEGMFDVCIEPNWPMSTDRAWHGVGLELLSPFPAKQKVAVRATGQVLVPPPGVRLGVISDIDDTVIKADITHWLELARNVFLRNSHTRLPFPGVAAFYRALFHGSLGNEMNPIFYVSGSPWNIYDLLDDFFQLHNIPFGPILFLRNFGVNEESLLPAQLQEHKLGTIRQILNFYSELPFILIGDSGQKDPEIYAQIVDEHPQRIQAIYIRNVSIDLARSEAIRKLAREVVKADSTLILADDSLVMAEHAAKQSWISGESLAKIRAEKERDEGPPSLMEKLLGQEEAPIIEVEGGEPEPERDTEHE